MRWGTSAVLLLGLLSERARGQEQPAPSPGGSPPEPHRCITAASLFLAVAVDAAEVYSARGACSPQGLEFLLQASEHALACLKQELADAELAPEAPAVRSAIAELNAARGDLRGAPEGPALTSACRHLGNAAHRLAEVADRYGLGAATGASSSLW
jgi:hypothetical protein